MSSTLEYGIVWCGRKKMDLVGEVGHSVEGGLGRVHCRARMRRGRAERSGQWGV